MHFGDRPKNLLRFGYFGQVPHCPLLHHLLNITQLDMKRQADNPGIRGMVPDLLRGFNAAHAGQTDIHDHNMRAQFPEQFDRLNAGEMVDMFEQGK